MLRRKERALHFRLENLKVKCIVLFKNKRTIERMNEANGMEWNWCGSFRATHLDDTDMIKNLIAECCKY